MEATLPEVKPSFTFGRFTFYFSWVPESCICLLYFCWRKGGKLKISSSDTTHMQAFLCFLFCSNCAGMSVICDLSGADKRALSRGLDLRGCTSYFKRALSASAASRSILTIVIFVQQ